MSAFTEMADRYEEVEAENERLYMQVRELTAERDALLNTLKEIVSNARYHKRGVWTVTWGQVEKAKLHTSDPSAGGE